MKAIVYQGNCLDVLAELPEASVDAVVTDPPYELAFMGKKWDGSGVAFDPQTWALCLRVLKPGGHLLAFGGSRTWHRLACAIEDAGFDVRDSIAWLYGSGFPKSLDVSKAIDKSAGAEREVIGERSAKVAFDTAHEGGGGWSAGVVKDTLPATDAAKQWAGWGTALKPSFEPIVVARKPLIGTTVNVRANIEAQLREQGVTGDIAWTKPASAAAKQRRTKRSGSTNPAPTVATSAKTASGSEMPTTAHASPTCTANHSGDSMNGIQTGDSRSDSSMPASCETSSARTMAPTANAAANIETNSSPSTTSTEAAQPIESQSTARSTHNCVSSDTRPDTESFAGIATGLTGSAAHVHISKNTDGTFEWPTELPEKVSGPATVAANVLEHGTGALNIDACRVEAADALVRPAVSRSDNAVYGKGLGAGVQSEPAGRWPTNAVLDHHQAAELDQQSGVMRDGVAVQRNRSGEKPASVYGKYGTTTDDQGYGGSGGASRFFPTFKYQAKAPAKERPKVDGVAHPTVKPLALMRWLVKLVTPPDGIVLDPFAGSGTTIEAALLEQMNVVGIEREAEYIPLIQARLDRLNGRS